jgi:hypothetical protein
MPSLEFACLHVPGSAGGPELAATLLALARECAPRVELRRDDTVLIDAAGLARLFGGARGLGEHLHQAAAQRGLEASVALASTKTAAMLMAAGRDGITLVPAGREAAALAPLPVSLLHLFEDNERADVARRVAGTLPGAPADDEPTPARHYRIAPGPGRGWQAPRGPVLARGPGSNPAEAGSSRAITASSARGKSLDPARGKPLDAARGKPLAMALDILDRWGIATCGELAALPPADLYERLGETGTRLRRLARGADDRPLVRAPDEERFEQAIDLEWPIEGLEPLSFVLARLLDPLSAQLERRDRGAAAIHVWLTLVTRAVHHRWLDLPVAMRDARVLRTLLLLDLESHPPPAGIDRVMVAAEPAPGRVVQFSLLARPLPSPDQISTLLARLTALMGEGRCGSPALVDSHHPGAFALAEFAPEQAPARPTRRASSAGDDSVRLTDDRTLPDGASPAAPASVLRRFRRPLVATVITDGGHPVHVSPRGTSLAGGQVQVASGPWRTSGGWWNDAGRVAGACPGWDRDEWDVALDDRAVYRVFHDRRTRQWFVEGCWD